MKNELLELQSTELKEITFMGDTLLAVKVKSTGKIFVGVNWICDALGFTLSQRKSQAEKIREDIVLSKGVGTFRLPSKGGNQQSLCIEHEFIPLWMAKIIITNKMKNETPDIVDKLIAYQLKAKDVLAKAFLGKTKEWNLQREVGKIDRNRMTSSISKNIFNAQSKTYADYTNMVYNVLFNMTAKEIRETRNIKKNSQLTRDYLSEQELKLVDEAETIVTALVSLGFKKNYILQQLRSKFTKQITGQN